MIKQGTTTARPARVVVLGASGFVGAALVRGLSAHGHEVLGLSTRDLDLASSDADSRLSGILRETDSVVFVSAVTPEHGKGPTTFHLNVSMAAPVAAQLERSRIAHLVYMSSDAVYPEDVPVVREDMPMGPPALHGAAHAARERVLAHAAAVAKVPFLALRPCAIYGPGDTHNAYGPNRFCRDARRERVIRLFGEGEEIRDHVHVGDVATLTRRCLERRTEGVLNVATGRAVSFRTLAGEVRALAGPDVQIRTSPRANPVWHRHFDVTTLARAFPDFRPTPLAEGLAETLREAPADSKPMPPSPVKVSP